MDQLPQRPMNRAKPPPPPIRVPPTCSGSRPATPTASSPQKLLYELPPSSSLRSPPPSTPTNRSWARSRSPPSANSRRTSFGAVLQTRSLDGQQVVSSPKRHAASLGGNEPKQTDLDAFTEACRRWYYEQKELAAKQMSQALANVDPSHRATYTRIQASVRSAFHADQTTRKNTEFRALVSSTQSGNSLTPAARSNPVGPLARKERMDKLVHLIQTHCLSDVPGTQPFFVGLYGALRLQSLPEKLGGAGERLIEWEIDDAVFLESAGKDFTIEAITVLKGALAFEETVGDFAGSLPEPNVIADDTSDYEGDAFDPAPSSTRLQHITPSPSYSSPIAVTRDRTSSDPFIDPSRSQASTLVALGSSPPDHDTLAESEQGQWTPTRGRPRMRHYTLDLQNTFSEPHFRVWTFPNFISNPELQQLTTLFPSFITKRSILRFPVRSSLTSTSKTNTTPIDLEEGMMGYTAHESSIIGPGEIRVGTGKLRLCEQRRGEGWRGSFWERMRQWFRNIFR